MSIGIDIKYEHITHIIHAMVMSQEIFPSPVWFPLASVPLSEIAIMIINKTIAATAKAIVGPHPKKKIGASSKWL